MKLLRICITSILSIWAPKFGGGPVLAHHLANGLHQRNYDVRVVYTKPSRQPNTTPDYPVSWVHHSDHIITNLLPIIWGVSCLANEQRFDIYHATGVEGFFIASWPGRKSPFVYSEYYPELPILPNLQQGSWITALKNLFRYRYFYLARHIARRANRVVVLSKYAAKQAMETYGIPAKRISIIPWGVDTTLFTREDRKNIIDQVVNIAWVARVEKSKGIDILLEAFSRVVLEFPSVQLVIVGGGEIKVAKDQAARLGILGNIQFTGHLPNSNCAEVLKNSNIFVLPSRVESFGGVLLEAMACGLAIVASRVGGIPEVIEHEKTGLLVEVENVYELSNALIRLITDIPLRNRLAAAGYQQVINSGRFTWDSFIDEHCELYEQLMTRK